MHFWTKIELLKIISRLQRTNPELTELTLSVGSTLSGAGDSDSKSWDPEVERVRGAPARASCPCTWKKDSTAGWRTRTACVSELLLSSVRQSPRVAHREDTLSCSERGPSPPVLGLTIYNKKFVEYIRI